MNHSVLSLILCMILSVTSRQFLYAQGTGSAPRTIRTEDKQYITTGSVRIPSPIDEARRVIENTDRWNDWMFTGMDGDGPAERFLIVYITGVEFSVPDAMNALVEFRFLRNLGKDRTPIPFILKRQYTESGTLSGITAVLARKNTMLDSARYEISFSGTEHETKIDYTATARLRGFFEFFVTLNSYTKTIAWYLEKIVGNFTRQALP